MNPTPAEISFRLNHFSINVTRKFYEVTNRYGTSIPEGRLGRMIVKMRQDFEALSVQRDVIDGYFAYQAQQPTANKFVHEQECKRFYRFVESAAMLEKALHVSEILAKNEMVMNYGLAAPSNFMPPTTYYPMPAVDPNQFMTPPHFAAPSSLATPPSLPRTDTPASQGTSTPEPASTLPDLSVSDDDLRQLRYILDGSETFQTLDQPSTSAASTSKAAPPSYEEAVSTETIATHEWIAAQEAKSRAVTGGGHLKHHERVSISEDDELHSPDIISRNTAALCTDADTGRQRDTLGVYSVTADHIEMDLNTRAIVNVQKLEGEKPLLTNLTRSLMHAKHKVFVKLSSGQIYSFVNIQHMNEYIARTRRYRVKNAFRDLKLSAINLYKPSKEPHRIVQMDLYDRNLILTTNGASKIDPRYPIFNGRIRPIRERALDGTLKPQIIFINKCTTFNDGLPSETEESQEVSSSPASEEA